MPFSSRLIAASAVFLIAVTFQGAGQTPPPYKWKLPLGEGNNIIAGRLRAEPQRNVHMLEERRELIDFLKSLTDSAVLTDKRFSDPWRNQ